MSVYAYQIFIVMLVIYVVAVSGFAIAQSSKHQLSMGAFLALLMFGAGPAWSASYPLISAENSYNNYILVLVAVYGLYLLQSIYFCAKCVQWFRSLEPKARRADIRCAVKIVVPCVTWFLICLVCCIVTSASTLGLWRDGIRIY